MGEAAWFQIYDEEDQPNGLIIIGEYVGVGDDIDPAELAREAISAQFRLQRIHIS